MADGTDKDNGDYLGYGVYAETLWARVVSALDRDHQGERRLGDDPLVVGIFGEWGAGKSTLLKLIEHHAVERAQERAAWRKHDGGNFSLTVPVFFQPWKYEHEPHLHVPILLHILAALKQHMEQAQTPVEWAQGKVPEVIKQHMDLVVGTFSLLLAGAAFAMDTMVPLSSRVALAGAGLLAKVLPKLNPDASKEELAKTLEYKENGRFFYEMHETLQAITRPRRYSKNLTGVDLSTDVSINFVIFIDDLDRCLPEKAVETLELIKTVFNLESFAFVLALDEEVVERGIGHRYKDYALVNKKPEMPITGFEYLEKIVHLPFRLPGLTPRKALQFLQQYEQEHVLSAHLKGKYIPQAWMLEREFELHKIEQLTRGSANERGAGWKRGDPLQTTESVTLNLAALVVNSFDAHVPRKLVRVVELFHQTLAVLTHRGRFEQVVPGGLIDPRLLMAFVLLQLFQPDLYRTCRRSLTGFNVLLDATREPEKAMLESRPAAKSLSKRTSDADLWHWAVGWVGDKPPVSQRAALLRVPDLQPVERHEAQRIQLPLAGRLVEHRATQRHVFDAMRLFEQLRPLRDESGGQLTNSAVYFGVLALAEQTNAVEGAEFEVLLRKDTLNDAVQTHGLETIVAGANDETVLGGTLPHLQGSLVSHDLDELHAILTSGLDAERERLYKNVGLTAGETLNAEREEALLSRLEVEQRQITGTNTKELSIWRSRVLDGLRYLAPHLDRVSNGGRWWALVRDADAMDSPVGPFKSKAALRSRVRWMDVQAALGQDNRFDPKRFCLSRQRRSSNERNTEREPIPGFVRVFENKQEIFRPFEGPPVTLKPYYMARYLTTVDQYAHFVAARGYGDPNGQKPDWWDSLGWSWRTGRWDSQEKDKAFRDHLAVRMPEHRGEPMQWTDQLTHGSRPVTYLNWFEARAYANWLTQQLKDELARLPAGYAVRLPTEAQWERAARAKDLNSADSRQYPWDWEEKKTAHLHANIGRSDIDRPSPVGLFAPNPLGLCDLSGNVSEWQSNLYSPDGAKQNQGLGADVSQLKIHHEIDKCDLPALRGGAWFNAADDARASIRDGFQPVFTSISVGFRVVLSLAK